MDSITKNSDGKQTRDFTFVGNDAQANIKAMLGQVELTKAEVENIAYGQRILLNQLWNELLSISGKDIIASYGRPLASDTRDSLGDISRGKQLIGYEHQFTVFDGLKITNE